MRDLISFIGFVTAIFTASISVIFIGNEISCSSYEKETGRKTKTAVLNCYIKREGLWYTKDEYKFIEINKKD